jgi:Glu-tRNA(Gln) amidotransferase subunit E-like FAD-binding protein
MGIVMEEVRGSIDGKVVSETLEREIDRILDE